MHGYVNERSIPKKATSNLGGPYVKSIDGGQRFLKVKMKFLPAFRFITVRTCGYQMHFVESKDTNDT